MKTGTIKQDYYGASLFIEKSNKKELTIFIIDDNKVYANLVKNILAHPRYYVLTFATGEEALDCMDLKPDLVLLDYHLDGVNPHAQKGDVIFKLIKEKSPGTEIIMVSSDDKFKFITDLHLTQAKNLFYKDKKIYSKIFDKVESSFFLKQVSSIKKKHLYVSLVFVVFGFLISFYFTLNV